MAVPVDLDIDAILDAAETEQRTSKDSVPIPTHSINGDIKMTAQALPKNPLEGFVKLHDKVHIYAPSTSPPADCNDPGFIFFCSWAFAQPRHISKYLKGYQSMYPHSTILLVQNQINNMLFSPDSWQFAAYFNLAAQQLHSYIDSLGSATPRILLQTFSNGGSHSAVQTAEAYKKQYGSDLPISAMILDSTPGKPHWMETASAMMQGLPKSVPVRAVGAVAIQTTLAVTTLMHVTGIAELATWKLYRTLNDPNEAFLKAHIPRTYIHSQKDVMILSRDVEAHAEIAKTRLQEKAAEGDMVRVEEFVDTVHVNHMASDPARYWKIVQDTWDKALR
ncbi:uncharacterized protein HMPREF1541_03996 [Cyphellophora europaea CBS 101466]|uniref:Uncharacterized protein n=1 Tax=Cyphellophora europaea (strain CBS 101466) TaxID=1220924 RepID=W2S042_CYPE1|nr:uncharacterized protein HMPREF1541_03996 [Cyphellophora europaea CBS 101466]ETN42057.1 hypothetical protein HMPREF1541_03996 [Cyphellophora europaea CBS 101466]